MGAQNEWFCVKAHPVGSVFGLSLMNGCLAVKVGTTRNRPRQPAGFRGVWPGPGGRRRLACVPLRNKHLTREICLRRRRAPPSPLVQRFVTAVRAAATAR